VATPAPSGQATDDVVPYANQWEYLDDWFTLVSGAIDSWLSPEGKAAKPRPPRLRPQRKLLRLPSQLQEPVHVVRVNRSAVADEVGPIVR